MQVNSSEFIVQFQRKDQVDRDEWNHGQTSVNEAHAISIAGEYYKLHPAVRVVEVSRKTRYARWK